MKDAIDRTPLPRDTQKALLGQEGPFTPLFKLVLAYEEGKWAQVPALAAKAGVDESVLPGAYAAAVAWAREFFEQGGASR